MQKEQAAFWGKYQENSFITVCSFGFMAAFTSAYLSASTSHLNVHNVL